MSTTSTGRQLIETHLQELGAILQRQVTKDTDLLIALHKPSKAKIEKAQKLGIRIVYVEDYLADN